MSASFPTSIWDGDSGNRDSDDGTQRAPDYRDWDRIIAEMIEVQKSNQGYDPVAQETRGVLGVTSGLSVKERGNAAIHKTIIDLDEVEMATTDGTTPATDGAWGTIPLYTFPVGRILLLSTHQVFPLGKLEAVTGGGTGLSDTADFEIGVGMTARGQATNFALQAGEKDVCGAADCDLTSGTSDAIETAAAAAVAYVDGTTAKVANLNVVGLGDDDHGTTADVLKVSGTITLVWCVCGDD